MKSLKYRTTLGASKIRPWDARFAFFWYNDEEIFRDTEKDLERKAEILAESGVNHVITFSCTHFRWSFHSYWDLLNETLSKLVQACHKHGILVTEHHSSELSHYIGDDDDLAYIKNILRVRKSSLDSWPEMVKSAKGDPILFEGVRRSEMIQVDGAVGGFRQNGYHAYSMCFNNPIYRRAYFKYLETVYGTGVDGIMTDDVQWIGSDFYHNACACEHCRALFAERTGLELPPNGGAWSKFIGDYSDPLYRAWLDFRFRTIEDFHMAVKEHYESLNLRLLRPNYCSGVISSNPSAYALETLPHLDWVFQESCFSAIIRYCWPGWAIEQAHRYALGRSRGIPSMDMFYPDRPDTTIFCWALAASWGGKYLATDEGEGENTTEKGLRQFEEKHEKLLRNQKKVAKIAFFDSKRNRELYGNYDGSSAKWTVSWMEACLLNNLSCDFILATEIADIASYDLVVLPDIAVLSDAEIAAFAKFAENGGIVIWGASSGSLDSDGEERSSANLAKLLRVDSIPDASESPATLDLGAGHIIFLSGDFKKTSQLPGPTLMRFDPDAKERRVPYESFSEERRRKFREIAEFLESLPPNGKRLTINGLPEDVLAAIFATRDDSALALHIVNASGTLLSASPDGVNHEDVIPFPKFDSKTIEVEIDLPRTFRGRELKRVSAHDPFKDTPEELDFSLDPEKGKATTSFDLSHLNEYLLIEFSFERS